MCCISAFPGAGKAVVSIGLSSFAKLLGGWLGDRVTYSVRTFEGGALFIWQHLGAELDEFIRKHDHHFAAEPTGAESTSWLRAVDLISGQFGLGCAGWKA
jgi:hypothetical protein